MAEEKATTTPAAKPAAAATAPATAAKPAAAKPAAAQPAGNGRPGQRSGGRGRFGGNRDNKKGGRDGRRGRRKRPERAPREYEQKILDLSRVTRVTAGGKRMSFRCALVIGDKKGKVGFGVAKGADVQIAIEKAYKQAKRNVIKVPMVNETIPHPVRMKFGAAYVLLKPAPVGTGLKSGGAMRMVLEFAGVPNVVSKIMNSNNKINIAKATLEAIKVLRIVEGAEKPKKEAKKEAKAEAKTE